MAIRVVCLGWLINLPCDKFMQLKVLVLPDAVSKVVEELIRRKVSGTTRSDAGQDCRDTFLSLAKTCKKLGIPFWHYLGARLGATAADIVPSLPELVTARCSA